MVPTVCDLLPMIRRPWLEPADDDTSCAPEAPLPCWPMPLSAMDSAHARRALSVPENPINRR
jgi:hypothetical protein